MSHDPGHTVLLVETDASLRRLIVLGLQYRGIQVVEAGSLADLSSSEIERHQPDLLVLDVDRGSSSDWSLLETAQAVPFLSTLPAVALAWECLPVESTVQHASQPQVTCLAKPFDARTLHTTIEQLLATSKQHIVAQAQAASPMLSLCPIITAAGLLLVFIGLMVQLILSGVGILIVLAGLLYWTLGIRPEGPVSTLPVMIGQAPARGASTPL